MHINPHASVDLIYFTVVAECGSFQAAADRLHMDRSALSRRVAALEHALGVQLLRRSTRSVSLTEAGRVIAGHGRSMRTIMQDVRQVADDNLQKISGALRICCATHFGAHWVQPVISRFLSRYPDVSVELQLSNRRTDLIAEGFDLAIRIGELKHSSLIARTLCSNPVLLLASPDFLRRHGPIEDVQTLLRLPAASYRADGIEHRTLEWFDAHGKQVSADMHVVFWSNDPQALLQAACDGVAWAVLPAFMAFSALKQQALRRLLPELKLPEFGGIHAVYHQRLPPARVRLFIETLQEHIGYPPVWQQA